jgi:hypothetical protein
MVLHRVHFLHFAVVVVNKYVVTRFQSEQMRDMPRIRVMG